MLNLFRNNQFKGLFAVIFFTLFMRAALLFAQDEQPAVYATGPMAYLFSWLYPADAPQWQHYLSTGLVFLFSLITGFSLCALINRYEILYRPTFLPAFFIFYFMHLFTQQMVVNPHFLGTLLLMPAIFRFMAIDPKNLKNNSFIEIGFFCGCCYCLSQDMVLFVPAMLLGLMLSGYLNIKTFFLLILGFFVPLYFMGVGYFLADSWDIFRTYFDFNFLETEINFQKFEMYPFRLGIASITALILLSSLLGLRANYFKNTIMARRSQQMLLFIFISGLALVLLSKAPIEQSISVVSVPLATFVSYYFIKTGKPAIRESLFAFFIILLIIAFYLK